MVMSIIISLYLILFITHFIIRSWWKQNRYKSLPPGPTPIPVLGTPKYMDLRYAKRNFTKLSQKYGSVFTIWKKSEPVIVLCGYDTVKDGLMDNAECFCERPYIPVVYNFSKGYDVNGPRWRSLRRFTVDFLRKYGMGKKVMEMRILEESKYLVQAVAESGGKVFNPTMALSCAVGNTMGGMMFGLHFDYKDKQLHDLLFSITKHIRGFVSPLSTVVCHNFMGHITICSRPFRNITLAAG